MEDEPLDERPLFELKPGARQHRFSVWDGSQDPLGDEADALFDRLSEDVFHGWDFETALRRLLSQGWRDRDGRKFAGLEELMERLRKQRQKQLERYSLDNVFKDIEEKLDNVLRLEREGIDERLQNATDASAKRILERVASKRRELLDNLPQEPGGVIKELQGYEFMDQRAEQAFQKLVEAIKQNVVDTYFKQMSQQMSQMSKQDITALREMARDLNALVRQKLEGVPQAQLQHNYEDFLKRWGSMFPDAPATFDEFLAQLAAQMARMDSLMQSLSPEMRHQLEEMVAATFSDEDLQAQLAELMSGLELLSDRRHLGQRYGFFGNEQLPFDEAMGVMDRLQSIEELERGLRGMYRGEPLDTATEEALRDVLGENAARDLSRLQRMTDQLEQRGLVERDGEGMKLTARGLRRIGQKALGDLFARLRRDRFGDHPIARHGQGGEREEDTKPYEFGDVFDLDVRETLMNAVRRDADDSSLLGADGGTSAPATPQAVSPPRMSPRPDAQRGRRRPIPRLAPEDFVVHRSDTLTRSATVLMLDMSRSMPLRGYFYAAKKVALALDSLIRSAYPRDTLHIIGFSDLAREISPAALPHLSVNEYVYGTNMQHGLMLARRLLARDPGENKQIIIVSDGEPTAHIENGRPVFFYPPLPETFHKTLLEVKRCTRENIVINTFMLESNHHLVQFVNQMTRLNRGRAFFISPDRLGDYVLVDYVSSKRGAA
ncbi:MAG TPA: VWA domain-containing protein [Candidatus Saccharimonadales bacterium]|nr:VWA domain-containing protein [Candidatus Saccharimonadales bacterium]